jgi:YVTN family beta-propeller protein
VVGSIASAAPQAETAQAQDARPAMGSIVVANRASGTISVIDVSTDQVTATINLPDGANAPEPMYVVYSRPSDRVFVGDRANDRVVVFRASDFSYEASVPAGTGVFHMWADPQNNQLWVNNDIDKTVTVFSPKTLEVLATVPMPADLVALGGKPHDVVLDTGHAYVSMLGVAGENDYVVKFSRQAFEEVGRAAVGQDPHVSLRQSSPYLYVPSQNSNVVIVLDRRTMEQVTEIAIPGAHGAGMAFVGDVFYTTNLTGGGSDALWTIDTGSNTVIGEPVDASYPVPHNIALTAPIPQKVYVTHSGGTSDKVTVYTTSRENPVPVPVGDVTVGFNPFGLAFVP